MSPSAPMPQMAWVAMNGLNAWVIVLSGELSMINVGVAADFDELGELLDEPHAATPAARMATALTATSFLGPRNLLIIFVSCRREGQVVPRCVRRSASSSCPTPLRLRNNTG